MRTEAPDHRKTWERFFFAMWPEILSLVLWSLIIFGAYKMVHHVFLL